MINFCSLCSCEYAKIELSTHPTERYSVYIVLILPHHPNRISVHFLEANVELRTEIVNVALNVL
jgi:hypothetical protein